MAKKGYIVLEGAKVFCSSSVANNSKATAVPLQVKSQKKKLGKNKYFAQEKPIATYLDDKADSFGGGNGFGNCKGSDGKPYPCKAKCNIKYKDYYENVDFNKSMKVLLDVSTGTCSGYGVPGTIQFATTGQSNNASQIDVKEADEFSVANASPQWETKDPADKTKTSVSSIYMISPIPVTELKDTYYYIQQANNSWSPFSNFNILTPKLTLKANFKGEVTKIIWTLFKGEGVKDKVKTFIGLGGQFNQDLDSIFKNLEDGKYKIEAYGAKPGDAKCTLHIEVVKDFVKKITIPASSIINISVPVSLERKVGSPLEQSRILNKSIQTSVIPSAYWRIKEGNNILHNTFAGTISPNIVSVISSPSGILVTFKNKGKYTLEAFTNPNETKPETATIEIKSTLGIETIDHGSSLLRYNDNFSVWVKGFNAIYIPDGAFKTVNWYLKKEGTGRLRALESSASFKALKINKRIDEFLFRDAGVINGNYFGKYSIEAYANPLGAGKEPQFSGGDCFNFEVIKNSIDQLAIPATTVPQGTKVKYTATARISPLISGETIRVEVPQGVTNNGDSMLTFTELGEFTISAHMEGQYTDPKVTQTKIKVAQPKLKRALWAYGTGVKRTETGYEEETYGFLEIEGLQNQALKVKIWVKGETDGFYQEPAKYMLEEKPVTLNSEGKASFQITTNATYKEKIEKAIPKTADNPNPQYRLVFTIEPQIASTADIIFPSNFSIEGTKSVAIQGGATLLEVLESNEELTLTTEQKIVSIMFSTEDGKDIQRTQTFYGKTHKLWVHTVNMQDETLKVDVFKEVPKEAMNEVNHIIYTHESKQSYNEEKVGKDGLLEVSFTAKEEWKTPPKNFDYYIAQVSRQLKDPTDETKKIWKAEKIQVTINDTLSADLVRTEDMEKLGIKAYKQDGTPFTLAEMLELRKQFIFYQQGCLKVSQLTTPEVVDNDVVPVMVEMAEVKKEDGECQRCRAKITLPELQQVFFNGSKSLMEKCLPYINEYFEKFQINTCKRKAHFFAQVRTETDLVTLTESLKYKYETLFNSDLDYYKGNAERCRRDALDERAIGINAYGSRLGNRAGTEDGFNFRGRGFIMVTGRTNYEGFQKFYNKHREELGLPQEKFIALDGNYSGEHPEKLAEEKYAVLSGISFWVSNGLNEIVTAGIDELKIINELVNVINSKTHSRDKRRASYKGGKYLYKKKEGNYETGTKTIFKVDECRKTNDTNLVLTGKAPWMPFAFPEIGQKAIAGEQNNPRINVYFNASSNGAGLNEGTNWCGAFVSWVFAQAGYTPPPLSCRAAMWQFWKQLDKPIYGAAAVIDWDSNELASPNGVGGNVGGAGHITFVIGKSTDGNHYYCVGGNQGGVKGARTVKISKYSKSDIDWFVIPPNYTPAEDEYNLKIMNSEADVDSQSNTRSN
ncbi:hypothetical protein [Chryseobacterium aquaticum]|uniref:Peptidase C51 domain-containing protein n=1 Tax=Chryseobacterium aquaticum subsp. greenlandense TaxID=345663 RepID=A0A101CFL8_9FLAO|nr:hypothetical protein [Chryseobacterium aquaticum]KUJ55383.1 hypothetical protein AR686_13490 [Chryseobacterium aquaticum subsp. greenlandense]